MATETEISFRERLAALRAQQAVLKARQIQDAPDPADQKQPMGLAFFLPVLGFTVILDLVDAFTAGTIGWLVGIFGDMVLLLVFGMSKGGRKQLRKMLISVLGEKIPVVATLPLRTVMLVIAYVQSNPKITERLGTVAKVAGYIPTPQTQALARGFQVASRAARAAQLASNSRVGAARAALELKRGFTARPEGVRRAA